MGPILIFGHKNPDNDSICSAVAYAHLKNRTDPDNVYLPARLGPVPPETSWAFARFGVELPEEILHVHTRVRDVMTEEVVVVEPTATMLEAGRLMREHGVRALPVVEEGRVRGIVNERILSEMYLEETEILGFTKVPVAAKRLATVVEGAVLEGDPEQRVSGNVLIGAMEPSTMLTYIKPGDTLIVGDRLRSQPMALEAGVACLIVTGAATPDPGVLDLARARGAVVVSTHLDTYAAARRVNLSHAVSDHVDVSVPLIDPETLLIEAAEDLLASPHREAVVVDDAGVLVGILTRTNLALGTRRRVVLVDHNEASQSAPGIEEAAIVEIVDHHRVGDVQTVGPILFLNLPVGATATVVARRYAELGVDIPEPMAGLLLSAILSDTVLLKSPTTTETDTQVARQLASVLGEDLLEFGMEMFRARSAGRSFSAEEAVMADLKEYRTGDLTVAIGQVETVDAAGILRHAGDIEAVMTRLRENRAYDLVILMVTDVVREGSEVFAVGKTRLAEKAFGSSFSAGPVWMDGVLSRKKQVAPRLVEAS